MTDRGISVVICTHNGAQRLPAVLDHLAAQQADVPWEVVLVDNVSTDGSAALAVSLWKQRVPLRVVSEPKLGLSFARRRGLREAAYPVVAFVDDDNWLAPDWVAQADALMGALPDVGALGGFIEPASDSKLPEWFGEYQHCYAIGAQADSAGIIGWDRGYIWGAGLVVRRDALRDLFDAGFEPRLTDRSGAGLAAGGDGELCMALLLAGWKLWYDPRLRMKHFLPAHRLSWAYLKRMWTGFGHANVVLQIYRDASWQPTRFRERLRQSWLWYELHAFKKVCWEHNPLKWWWRQARSWDEILFVYYRARFTGFLRLNVRYRAALRATRRAPWLRLRRTPA